MAMQGRNGRMKKVYLIGGSMGVGKTTVCKILKNRIENSVFLDGDWCWDMHPFAVTQETKTMVMENICFLLNQFIRCSACETILFCWVMHEQSIVDEIVSRLDTGTCSIRKISLVCRPKELKRRLQKDVDAGIRAEDVIARSMEKNKAYASLDTEKIDVSELTPEQTADRILTGRGEGEFLDRVKGKI